MRKLTPHKRQQTKFAQERKVQCRDRRTSEHVVCNAKGVTDEEGKTGRERKREKEGGNLCTFYLSRASQFV
jgi:hypothetical protein